MSSYALIQFELHAQSEDKANGDDGPIIEGSTQLYNLFESKSFVEHNRLYGEKCALDIKYLVLINAVEARVEVTVLRLCAVHGGVNMKLLDKTSGFISVMVSFAIAVETHSEFDLYIKGYPSGHPKVGQKKLVACSWWQCRFASG